MVVNEYGNLEGIVTQTDLLAAIAGHMPDVDGEESGIVEREDGALLIDGATPVMEAFQRLGLRPRSTGAYHTIAGFALRRFRRLPKVGRAFHLRRLALRDRRHGRTADRQAVGVALAERWRERRQIARRAEAERRNRTPEPSRAP
jgi:CBS domain containing-hemolysin-like protein